MDARQSSSVGKLRQFSVCQLIDGMGNSWPVETCIRPIDPQFRICGSALTVQCPPGDNLTLHYALHIAEPGDVLVVAGSPESRVALWGELMSISAQSKGLAGTIIDGPIRDPLEIRTLGYPVFCRGTTPYRAAKESYGRVNVPVKIGDILIRPDDLVLADANGIVAIPHIRAEQALQLASEIARKEGDIKDQIVAGRTIFEIFGLQQHVPLNQEPGTKAD